jgi:CDP-diacylglycerol---serine O-phosphatidyltransferase
VRQHVRPANLVTSVSICAGFLALVATSSRLALATALILLAALLDVVDGALARRAGGDHTFGAQLDSLADLLCFCVAPALALHHASSAQPPVTGVLAGSSVILAGAWRLSRFPLVQEQGHFVGLPTPAAGVTIMLLVLGTPPGAALVGAVVLSALMVSSIRFPSVLAAAASVRPGDRAHALRRQLVRRRPPFVPLALARARRPRGRRPATGRPRRAGRAGQVLGTLRRGGARRRDLP